MLHKLDDRIETMEEEKLQIAKNSPIIGTIRPIIRNNPPKNSNTVAV
ncbi:MAG: hypothetical protein WB815_12470 [Nitrososphaeraceae archaeon]